MKARKYGQWLFVVLGFLLLSFLFYKTDIHKLKDIFLHLHLEYLVLLMAYTFIWRFLHALGYFIICRVKESQLRAYILIQILSNTISDLFFVGNTGGEIYRAYKMGSYYPSHKHRFWAMTIIYNAYYALAMLLVFLVSGLYLSLFWDFSRTLKITFTFVIAFLFLLLLLFLFLQSRGLFSSFLILFGRLPFSWAKRLSYYLLRHFLPIDKATRSFHIKYPWHTLFFVFIMFSSRLLTIGEVFLITLAMGISLSFSQAVLINVVDSFIRVAFFLIPNGQLGVIEGAMTSLGSLVGQSPTTMFGFSLVQRMRMLFWDFIGLILLWLEKHLRWFREKTTLDE